MDSDDKKISQLTRVTSLSDSDLFVVVVNLGTAPEAKAIEKSNLLITSGRWTPTLTNTTNVAASVAHLCQYMRIGDEVLVSGVLQIDPTAAAATVLKMSLPIASDFQNTEDCSGNISFVGASTSAVGSVVPDTTTNELYFSFTATQITNGFYRFMAQYRIR
jgi:hypothetical protein